jgi:probable HAF family extracellular repeat protein
MTTRHLGISAAVLFSAAAALAQSYTITDLGSLGGSSTVANAIAPSGTIVGVSETADAGFHAFAYAGLAMHDLGTLPKGQISSALAANSSSQIVGYSYDGSWRAVLWSKGKPIELGNLGTDDSFAWALNEKGDVAGSSKTGDKREHAFLYAGGKMTDLGTLGGKESSARGINSSRQITGYADDANDHALAFLWQDGKMSSIGTLGGNWSRGFAINEAGQIVGVAATDESGVSHAFLWSGGQMTDLGDIGEHTLRTSVAVALNSTGTVIVGHSAVNTYVSHAVVWLDGKIHDLNRLLRNGSGWTLLRATGVDDTGSIVGFGEYKGQQHAFLLTPEGKSGRRRAAR